MRVIIITQDDPFYIPIFFQEFFDVLNGSVNITRIYIQDPFNESFPDFILRMYRFYGPVNFLRRSLEYGAVMIANLMGVGMYSVDRVAETHDVPVERINSVNTDEFIDMIHRENIDLILSVSAPEIFKPNVLEAPSEGCLNVHTAELPKYRGMLPTFWALYHGEDEIGVTVHTMAEKIDAGEIAKQTTFSITDDNSLDEVIKRGKRIGGRLAAAALCEAASGELVTKPMKGQESYFSFPTADERREFQRRGWDIL